MKNIERYRGDTYADEIVIKRARTGLPLDITGYSFVMTLDPSETPDSNAGNLYALAGTVVDGPAGRVEFAPSPTQADRVGNFFYDVQMIDGAGRKRTVAKGRYIYKQDITKA